MTREENLHWLNQEIQTWENECQSKHPIKEALYAARRALEQESTTKNDLGVDAISRQAVIDELKRYFHDEYYQRTSIQDCRDCFIEDVLNHLPSVTSQEPRWIPITERLPNNSGRYLVSYGSGYVSKAYYYESVSKWGSTTTERIVAWMPLPEPYKGRD